MFFLPNVCQLCPRHTRHIGNFVDDSELEYIFKQIVANLPENVTEIVRFFKRI